jgi:glycosyltransferase involved in cell wall biosynthesis
MRLLHVTSSYPLHPGDATAPFMEEMTEALVKRGHSVRVIAPFTKDLQTGPRSGVEVAAFRYGPGQLRVWGYGRSVGSRGGIRPTAVVVAPFAMASMLATTRSAIRSWRPDIVHLHWLVPQGAIAPLLPASAPIVVSLHGADMGMVGRSGLLGTVAAAGIRRADHIVAASDEMIQLAATLEPTVLERSSVVLHGADRSTFHVADRATARTRLNLGTGGLLLAVGRLVPKKGFGYLIRSMSLLDDHQAHLYVAGDGPSRSDLAALAEQVAPGRVTFLGMVDRNTLSDWYAAADLVVVPSVKTERDIDSGPVVLMEALASGRAVVSTLVGMAPAVIENGYNGYLVSDADPRALAEAISTTLQQKERLGANAAESFQRIGDWDRVAEQLESVYETAQVHRAAHRT